MFSLLRRTLALSLFCLIVPAVFSQSAPELAAKAFGASLKKNYALSASLYQQAIDEGAKSPTLPYNAACSYALAGDREKAFAMLERAASAGFHAGSDIASDPDLASLHSDPRWPKLIERFLSNHAAFRLAHSSPDSAKFVTSDVALFWQVYDKLPKSTDPAGLLDQQYLNAGTVGVQDFVSGRIGSGKHLYETIQKHATFYAAIRVNTSKMKLSEPQVRASFRKFKQMYPDALFPDIYFVVGALNSGGTYSDDGLLLGAEMHALGDGVPTDELSPWEKSVVKSYTILPSIITHELMHFQQKHEANTLLAKAIHEGSADFLASLVSEGNFNAATYDYGYAHEAELWKEFRAEMLGTDTSKWLYGTSQRDGRPADLGYFIGFRISQAYYNKAKDKQQAIRDILTTSDFESLLKASGYGE